MPAIAVIKKRVAEKFEVVLRYTNPDIESTETISTSVATAATGLSVQGAVVIAGTEVSQMIYGGTSGVEYKLTFLTTISTGRILEHYVIIDVDD